MLRAATCGSAATSAMPATGEAGTPAASSALSQPAAPRRASAASSAALSASRCSVRSALPANRGSDASSGAPSTSQRRRNSRSLPAAITIRPSAVRKVSNGVIDGWREPSGAGSRPVAWYRARAFSRIDTTLSSMAMSTRAPRPPAPPPRSRRSSPASTPITPYRPLTRSATEVPARTVSPDSVPVIDSSPERAWMIMS